MVSIPIILNKTISNNTDMKAKKTSVQEVYDYQTHRSYRNNSSVFDFPSFCGGKIVYNLDPYASAKSQAAYLAQFLEYRYEDEGPLRGQSFQIVIADTVDSEAWAATKAVAHKGPITVNPNSGNKVRMWIITRNMLSDIFNSKL